MSIQAIDGVLQQLQLTSLQASGKPTESASQLDFGATMKAALDKISATRLRAVRRRILSWVNRASS